jgi:hypothetical protein
MRVRFLFSSSDGDIPVDDALLSRPFLLNPFEKHPLLRLGDYFKAIEHFLLVKKGDSLMDLLSGLWNRPVHVGHIEEVLIRSEKHGTLYHLASAEFFGLDLRAKFAVSGAVSETNRAWLYQEFETLKHLHETFGLPYLPEPCFLETLEWTTAGGPVPLSFMLSEWFEEYHEWHLSRSDAGVPHVVIWDLQNGYQRAEEWEAYEIYCGVSRILTLYYNVMSSHQIHPWHHAAGDFVVRNEGSRIDVRLTTARGYEPLMIFLEEQDINTVMALITFFLNLTIHMRLDRWDGVGELAWAPDFSVEPTVVGFFQALRTMEKEGRYDPGGADDFAALLKTFREDELRGLCVPLLDLYRREGGEVAGIVEEQLDRHCHTLRSVIQGLPG